MTFPKSRALFDSFQGHGDRHLGLRHGVHGARDDGRVQRDRLREARAQIHVLERLFGAP